MTMLGVSEAARALGTSRSAIRKAIVRGTLRAGIVPRGKRVEYAIAEAEIERYRQDHLRPGHRRAAA